MNKANSQIEQVLKAMKIFRWIFRFMAGGMVLLTSCFFGNALIERQTAAASRNWPAVQGRVVSSEVVVASQTSGGGTRRTSYRALIKYSYQVGTARFESVRVSFMGWGSSAGTMQRSDKSAARSDANRYPRGAEVKVFYNPQDPSEAVLEPGASHHNRNALIGSSAALVGVIVFLLVFRTLIAKFFRGAVAQQAEMYGPEVWETTAKYGLAPPSAPGLEAATPQPTIGLPFEAKAEVVSGRRSG